MASCEPSRQQQQFCCSQLGLYVVRQQVGSRSRCAQRSSGVTGMKVSAGQLVVRLAESRVQLNRIAVVDYRCGVLARGGVAVAAGDVVALALVRIAAATRSSQQRDEQGDP